MFSSSFSRSRNVLLMRTFEIPFLFVSTKCICEKKNGRRIHKDKKIKKKNTLFEFSSLPVSLS